MFKEYSYAVAQNESDKKAITGFRCGSSPLAYHEIQMFEGDEAPFDFPYSDRYTIDHIPTGLSLLYHKVFYTPAQCEAFIEALAPHVPEDIQALTYGERVALVTKFDEEYQRVLCQYPRFKRETIERAIMIIGTSEKSPHCLAYVEEILAYGKAFAYEYARNMEVSYAG